MDKASVFVKVESYQDINDLMTVIKERLNVARDLLGQLAELKRQEDQELESWRSDLDDVFQKLREVDEVLLKL